MGKKGKGRGKKRCTHNGFPECMDGSGRVVMMNCLLDIVSVGVSEYICPCK